MQRASTFIALTRGDVLRELERMRRQNLLSAAAILDLVTEENYIEVWPLVLPYMDEALRMQQRSGRRVMGSYIAASALASGLTNRPIMPDLDAISSYRDGLLPSGMPWYRLTSTLPMAVGHRVENGMSLEKALFRQKGKIYTAISDQIHSEARFTAQDILNVGRPTESVSTDMSDLVDGGLADIEREEAQGLWNPVTEINPVRYIRQPNAGACPWCLLQATRGAVFYSEGTAVSAGHNNCRCAVFPEPTPGAYRGIVLADESQLRDAVWRDTRRDQEINLSRYISKSRQFRADLRVTRDSVAPAA